MKLSPRIQISAILIILAGILAFLPLSAKYSLHGRPENILKKALDKESYLSPDQVARYIVTEDSSMQLIDLRTQKEYLENSIPGSINLPYYDFLNTDPVILLKQKNKTIFYSGDDYLANYAYVIAKGLGYENCYVMKGGLEGWYRDIMNTEFTGETISARENALFETRFRARKMFNDINSLPDSLKLKYLASREAERKKLDGGCE